MCFYHLTYGFRVNLHSVIARMSRNPLFEAGTIPEIYVTATGWTQTHNSLVRKQTLNHLNKRLIARLQTKKLWVRVLCTDFYKPDI